MKISSASGLLLLSLLCASCSERPGGEAPPDSLARQGPAKAQLDALARYRALEAQALAGDAQAQRQVADWLSGGNNGRPPVNHVVGCAWRLLLLERADDAARANDVAGKERHCENKLAAAELQAARSQSEALRQRMRGRQAIAAR